ncbi:GNAT family N-acetyltransferase [Nocardia alni]|uniref:GNAT family N-acetyltransferase n=1 Tax=Nocardia alni TaxID=2815723 RepID=UPI001C222970|nr:GNAT family N-acetyltransferase [Nocardia alni]
MAGTVRPATTSDIAELARVLGSAFADDPVFAWLLPDSTTRVRRLTTMFGTMARHQFLDTVDVVFDDAGVMVGAAGWAPPGRWAPSGLTQLRMAPALARALRGRTLVSARVADRMAQHHPDDPHWYLAFVGTLPTARGRGYGQALLAPRLAHCDAVASPAYLESSKPDNIPYYQRFGYEVQSELDITDGGPPLWPMWRAPR